MTIKTKFQQIVIVFLCTILLASCVKENLITTERTSASASSQEILSKINSDSIINWLKSKVGAVNPVKNRIIGGLLKNAIFKGIHVERFHDDERFVIVPLKNEYFSQHVKSTESDTNPIFIAGGKYRG